MSKPMYVALKRTRGGLLKYHIHRQGRLLCGRVTRKRGYTQYPDVDHWAHTTPSPFNLCKTCCQIEDKANQHRLIAAKVAPYLKGLISGKPHLLVNLNKPLWDGLSDDIQQDWVDVTLAVIDDYERRKD